MHKISLLTLHFEKRMPRNYTVPYRWCGAVRSAVLRLACFSCAESRWHISLLTLLVVSCSTLQRTDGRSQVCISPFPVGSPATEWYRPDDPLLQPS